MHAYPCQSLAICHLLSFNESGPSFGIECSLLTGLIAAEPSLQIALWLCFYRSRLTGCWSRQNLPIPRWKGPSIVNHCISSGPEALLVRSQGMHRPFAQSILRSTPEDWSSTTTIYHGRRLPSFAVLEPSTSSVACIVFVRRSRGTQLPRSILSSRTNLKSPHIRHSPVRRRWLALPHPTCQSF
jgi:hypothetical protein